MRINKFLAQAGLGSRRKVEELITSGKIKVNGKVCTLLFTDISEGDSVTYLNRPLTLSQNYEYYKLNKPKGYVTTLHDEKDRKTVADLMRGVHARVFPVGRLDYDTEGLLIMTNDGDLANYLTKPNSKIEKTYMAHIEGSLTKEEIKKLSSGVDIGGYITKPCSVMQTETDGQTSKIKITITEGKNRQIRKMLAALNKNVIYLKRIQIGNIHLGGLSRGEYAPLNPKELRYIKSLKS